MVFNFFSIFFCPLYHLIAHDCCEVVLVTLCSVSRGVPESPEDLKPCLGCVAPLAEHRFSFVQDLAFDMAQFLVSNKTSNFHSWVSCKINKKTKTKNKTKQKIKSWGLSQKRRQSGYHWLQVMQQSEQSDSKTKDCCVIVSSLTRLDVSKSSVFN